MRAELASGVRALFSRRPASLLDMPDDVLERIGHYLAVLDTKRTNCGTPRLKYHYVNRRLYRIFRPRWFRHLDLAFDKQGDERNLIEKLLWAADIRRFVTSAKVTLSKEEAEVEAIALGVLVHLEQLEIAMEPNGWNHRGWIPNAAHDAALASLAGRFPGLRVLTCGQYTTTDDDSILELKRSPLPQSLSTFGIRIYDSSLLSTALPDVRVISMVAVLSKMNPPQVSLPWYTLQTLSVGLSLSLAYNRWLAETLEIAVRPIYAASQFCRTDEFLRPVDSRWNRNNSTPPPQGVGDAVRANCEGLPARSRLHREHSPPPHNERPQDAAVEVRHRCDRRDGAHCAFRPAEPRSSL